MFNTERIDHIYQDPHVDNRNLILHYGDMTDSMNPVSYTHLRAHDTVLDLVCRLLLEQKTTYPRRINYIFH